MKKGWKIFWIACTISGIVGFAFLVAAFSMGITLQQIEDMMPGRLSIIGGDEITEETYDTNNSSDIYEGITALDIELTAGKVEILTTEDSEVEIVTENISDRLKLTYFRQGNTLVVDTREKLKGIVNQKLGTLYIYLPEEIQLDDVKISVGAGTLYIEEIYANDLSVDVGAGEAEITSFMVNKADFECGAGEMKVNGYAERKADIDCGMGNVTYYTSGSEEDYNYKFSCGVGTIICGSQSYSGIGSEQKVNNHAFGEMDIDCGIGEVVVKFNAM